jgi:hypothetical protein
VLSLVVWAAVVKAGIMVVSDEEHAWLNTI